MEYKVLRPHQGDKWYAQGDLREANEADVAHLVKSSVLKPAGQDDSAGGEGQETAPENKATAPSETTTQKPAAAGTDPAKQGKSKD